ncbi:PKD domain-containing protein [bacterium]|nr:PKD domain-containing protein [bacterium]
MYRGRAIFANLVLLAGLSLMSLLAACATSGYLPESPGATATPEVQPQDGTPDNPFGLPTPAELSKLVSYEIADRVADGALYSDTMGQQVEDTGTGAQFSPTWQPPSNMSTSDLAYAIYTFTLDDYADAEELCLGWSTAPANLSDIYVGVGYMDDEMWMWYTQAEDGTVAVPNLGAMIGPAGELYIAVVLTGTGNPVLDWVRIGANIPPRGVFTADKTIGDFPLDVEFDSSASTDLDGHIVIVEYDLDGNNFYEDSTSGLGIVSHNYSAAGTYDAKMKLIDDRGGLTTKVTTITVNDPSNEPPEAHLTANPTNIEVGQAVSFDASTSFDPDGSITLVEWDFDGNGTYETDTGTTLTTEHTYASLGTFNAAVRVFDNLNVSDTDSVTIKVTPETTNEPPVADLTASPDKGPKGTSVLFDASGSTDTDGTIELYEWDWDGDGVYDSASSTSTKTHTYNSGGLFNAVVRVTDDDDATDTAEVEVKIYHETEDNDTYATGNTWPGLETQHWYGHCGIDGYDGDFHDWYIVNVPAPGWVNFQMYHRHADSDLDMHLFDTDGTTQIDSATSTSDNELMTYEFAAAGTYYWEIYVHNEDLESAEYELETYTGQPPIADISATPTSGDIPVNVSFDASGSSDPDGFPLVKYEWDFDGDGTYDQNTGTTPTTSHNYTIAGVYQAKVRVTDNEDLTDEDTVTITAFGDGPVASFTAVPSSGNRPLLVDLDASASTGAITQYEWDFDGNGIVDLTKTSTSTDPKLAYAEYFMTGTFQVRLTVTDTYDPPRTDTTTRTITVTGSADSESEPNNDQDEANTAADASAADILPAFNFVNYWGQVGPIPEDEGPFGDPDDWFRFTLSSEQEVNFFLDLFDAVCDIDMRLYASGDYSTALASSTSTTDDENIEIVLDAGTYYLQIYSWNSTTNAGKLGGYRLLGNAGVPPPD